MDQDITESTFDQVLKQFPYEDFSKFIKDSKADKYIKKLFSIKLLYMLVIAQFCQTESLRDLSAKVKDDLELQKILKIDSISTSQLDGWVIIFIREGFTGCSHHVHTKFTMAVYNHNQKPTTIIEEVKI